MSLKGFTKKRCDHRVYGIEASLQSEKVDWRYIAIVKLSLSLLYQVSQKTLLKDICDYLAKKHFLGHPVFL